MPNALTNALRLARAGLVLAQHGVRFTPKGKETPPALKVAHAITAPVRWLSAPFRRGPRERRVSEALTRLGPSYIKLGQFLATRGDLIEPSLAADLQNLQDKQAPFSMRAAIRTVEVELGGVVGDHFAHFGPPVAAASIAQVHKATVHENGVERAVAVKILRPGIERRFRRDLDSYFFAARAIERLHPPSRRLRPVAVVENLARTTELEMDLRLEAAAMSEMADNAARDAGFKIPAVDWRRTAKRVLSIEWIDGTPIHDHDALRSQGRDLKALGMTVLRAFLTHAMRDGFFHADMHQGNLLVDDQGRLVAVDFGIMGRLGMRERRFLAEILHGLITRDYQRAADVHFWAGYVPPHHPPAVFAQALRAIGEPIHGKTAEEISMADLLGQLFAYTDVFDMETRPELILLQKSMVIVEGVARGLDPSLNLWMAAEPIAREWMENNLGPAGRLRDAGESASLIGKALAEAPRFLNQAEEAAAALTATFRDGVRLNDDTIRRLARETNREQRFTRLAFWAVGVAMGAFAVFMLLPAG